METYGTPCIYIYGDKWNKFTQRNLNKFTCALLTFAFKYTILVSTLYCLCLCHIYIYIYTHTHISYIWDTQDLLDKQHALYLLPFDSICTVDVTTPYPSIPHDDGLANLRNALLENSITTVAISCMCDMTELVLKRNVFEFNKEYFIQCSVTTIGTKLSPSYPNLFLSIFECELLDQYPIKPSICLRYIDDIFMIWNESEDKLKDFFTYINMVNPAIQFTHAYSSKSVNSMDALVTLTDDETIYTDIYRKPTDTHQYLHMNSCHPNHVKKASTFLQATQILCICGAPTTAQSRCNELIEYLVHHRHVRRSLSWRFNER